MAAKKKAAAELAARLKKEAQEKAAAEKAAQVKRFLMLLSVCLSVCRSFFLCLLVGAAGLVAPPLRRGRRLPETSGRNAGK